MIRSFSGVCLLVGLSLQGGVASAKEKAIGIDLSVAADGACLVRIGNATLSATGEELDAKLPALLPDRRVPVRFAASYETVPYRCFGPVMAALQRHGYKSIGFDAAPPPLEAIRPADPEPGE